MQLKTDWGNAKRLPESLFEWAYLWCRERRLRRARIKRFATLLPKEACEHLFAGEAGFEDAPCCKCGVMWSAAEQTTV